MFSVRVWWNKQSMLDITNSTVFYSSVKWQNWVERYFHHLKIPKSYRWGSNSWPLHLSRRRCYNQEIKWRTYNGSLHYLAYETEVTPYPTEVKDVFYNIYCKIYTALHQENNRNYKTSIKEYDFDNEHRGKKLNK